MQGLKILVRGGAVAAALALTVAPQAEALTIDSFTSIQFDAIVGGPLGPRTQSLGALPAPEALGGTRTITLERTSANGGTVIGDVNLTFLPGFGLATGPATTGGAALAYSTAPVDLTEGGTQTGVRIRATSDLGASMLLLVGSGSDFSAAQVSIAGDPTFAFQDYVIDFASLVPTGGNPANLTQITSLQLIINGSAHPGSDVGIALISTIPEPGTALLLATGLSGLAFAGRRRAA